MEENFNIEEKKKEMAKNLQWLEKQKKNQIDSIEKRIISERKEAEITKIIAIRVIIITFLSVLVIGGYLYYIKGLVSNLINTIIIIALFSSYVFGKTYYMIRGKHVQEKASNISKKKAKDDKIFKKYATEEEEQRLRIIEKEIEELKQKIESADNKENIIIEQNNQNVEKKDELKDNLSINTNIKY